MHSLAGPLFALLLLHSTAGGPPPAPATARLVLLDDRGRPIEAPLEVCIQVELRSNCIRPEAAAEVDVPAVFRSLRVEGDEHGPLARRREELDRDERDAFVIRVPRKAVLRIDAPAGPNGASTPLVLSLYPLDDPAFRRPTARVTVRPHRPLRVPAGRWVASLARAGAAPDLHLVAFAPAERQRIAYRSRRGWSLLVRCRDLPTGRLLSRARLTVRGAAGFSRGAAQTAVTSPEGLAVFTGLEHALAVASAEHPRHVPRELHGLAATAGTFAFEEVLLSAGGSLMATVRHGAEPVANARCRLLDADREPVAGRRAERVLLETRTDPSGRCSGGPFASGTYVLEIVPVERGTSAERQVEVRDGEAAEVAVDLVRIRLGGRITRGGEPAAGYRVEVTRSRAAGDGLAPVIEAVADDRGEYEAVLWDSGSFVLMALTPAGTPAAFPRQLTLESAEETEDFELPPGALRGTVVDAQGAPLAEVRLALREARMVRVAESGPAGEFELPVSTTGSATLRASKPGYVLDTPIELTIPEGGPAAPLVVRMRRSGLLRGTVMAAGGRVPGAWVAAAPVPASAGLPIRLAVANEAGRFEVEAPSSPARLFFGGPGCPLSLLELADPEAEHAVQCATPPAALVLHVRDADGRPVPHAAVRLRRGDVVVPHPVLAAHLAALGLPAESDAAGRLSLVALAPGAYEVFLADRSSEESVGLGVGDGWVGRVELAPLAVSELEVALPAPSG